MLAYADRPGVMGTVGTLLGEADVNIEAAQISQELSGALAIMVLRVDASPDADLLERIGQAVDARRHPGDPGRLSRRQSVRRTRARTVKSVTRLGR